MSTCDLWIWESGRGILKTLDEECLTGQARGRVAICLSRRGRGRGRETKKDRETGVPSSSRSVMMRAVILSLGV